MLRNIKNNQKAITEAWAPMIKKVTGVTDPDKLSWMSQLAHNTATSLNEDFTGYQGGGGVTAGTTGTMGGVYSPYSTLYNTIGVGNVVPAGKPSLTGADFADNRNLGSGDKFPALLPLALKVAAKTIGFELVNTTPLAGPSGVLPYMDYVYAGSKQPYGATPGNSESNANPREFRSQDPAFAMYGLPHAFKASLCVVDTSNDIVNADTAKERKVLKYGIINDTDAVNDASMLHAGDQIVFTAADAVYSASADSKTITGTAATLTTKFIGWSRIDGEPMFEIITGTAPLGSFFADYRTGAKLNLVTITSITSDYGLTDKTWTLKAPRLISMLEDQIQGFAGAGEHDQDSWYGTYQDGTRLYEPMSRATGELQYARQLSLQLFTKNVTVGTIAVAAAVTQEQVADLQKQWGIDVVKMVENAAVNELSATINRHITSRLFALGWKNQCKLVEVEGPQANMNITFDATATTKMTPKYAIPQGPATLDGNYQDQANVALPYVPIKLPTNAAFENRDTLLKRLQTNMMKASNWILQRGRYGAATFAVTNITTATALQSNAQYTFSPITNNISQNGGSLYPIGTMFGMTIYCDPLMAGNDTRILVGRKGGKEEPGTHFCPYIMAESVKIISEGTMAPKIQVKSRYSLVDAGFFPETQYITFAIDFNGLV